MVCGVEEQTEFGANKKNDNVKTVAIADVYCPDEYFP